MLDQNFDGPDARLWPILIDSSPVAAFTKWDFPAPVGPITAITTSSGDILEVSGIVPNINACLALLGVRSLKCKKAVEGK